MKLSYKIYFALSFSMLLSACGGGSSSGGLPDENTNSAYLIDSAVEGVSYEANTTTGTTDAEGKFFYTSNDTDITFKIGGITLGSYPLSSINSDRKLLIGELLGSGRDDSTDSKVALLLQFLQSLDSDGNALNGITIDENSALSLRDTTLDLRDSTIDEDDIKSLLDNLGKPLVSKEMAITYYEIYLNSIGYSIDTQNPIFLSRDSFSVNENQLHAFSVDVLDATAVTYSLGGDDGDDFTIDESGTVSFKVAPDYESNKTSYTLDVIAKDSTDKATTQTVHIDINDLVETTLKVPVLVVVMNWNDYHEDSVDDWEDKFFNKESDSVNRWLVETMHGAIEMEPAEETQGTENDGIVMVDMGKDHPGGSNNEDFRDTEIKNAITAADASVDFSKYDTNGDGVISTKELQIIFIVAGGEESFGDPQDHSIWAHQWSFSSNSGPEVDGVNVMQYSSDDEKAGTYARFGANHDDHQATIGIIVHEMGHSMLNLGDYYDTEGDTTGLGWYDVMSGGSWARKDGDDYAGQTPTQYTAFNRVDSGFDMNVTEVSDSTTLTIRCSNDDIIKLLTGVDNEYFLAACRDTAKADSDISLNYYDSDFTEDRLFMTLYHVDTDKDGNSEGGTQTADNHYKVALVEKDTSEVMTSDNHPSADFDDVYVVGDTIDSSRVKLYDGTATGYTLEVTAQDTTARTMTIKITKD